MAHGVMGKRMSGCEPQATYPLQGADDMPMMSMMNFSHARFGVYGWVLMLA